MSTRSGRSFNNEFGTEIVVDVRSRQIRLSGYSPTPDYYGPKPPEAVPGVFIRIEGRHKVNNLRNLGTVSENHVTRLEAEKIYACLGVVLGKQP